VWAAWLIRPQLSAPGLVSLGQPQDFPTLIARLEKTVQKNPNDTDAILTLANAYREVGDYANATAQFSELLIQDPANAAALLGQGKLQIAQGDFAGAVITLEQAATADPSNAEILNFQGDALFSQGQYDAAAGHYRRALKADPNNALAYTNLALVNMTQGNNIEAGRNLDLAVTNDPNLIIAHLARGQYLVAQGDATGADEEYRKVIALPATIAEEYTYRGMAHRNLGEDEEAIQEFNQALSLNPNYAQGYAGRAGVLYDAPLLSFKGDLLAAQPDVAWQDSIDAYAQALVVNPNDPDVLGSSCRALLAQGDLDLALADCSRGLATNPNSALLHEQIGSVRIAKNDYAGAVKDFTRSIEITDGDGSAPVAQANAYASRAYSFLQIGTLDKALADINQAMTLVVDDPNVYYTRGLILAKQGDKSGGAADLSKAAELYLQAGDTESQQSVLDEMKTLGL
jgi:Flp pilus assembly protein TadD